MTAARPIPSAVQPLSPHAKKEIYNKTPSHNTGRAKKEKAKWERDCAISAGFGAAFAWTGIAPAVAAGLCAKYIDTVGDKQAALDKLNSRLSTAQSKVRTAQNYEDQYNTAKSKLSHVKRIQNRLESSKKCVQSSVYVQKTILKELAELLEKIQTCKTQVDMIQARFNTVQGKFKHILTNNYKTDSFSVAQSLRCLTNNTKMFILGAPS